MNNVGRTASKNWLSLVLIFFFTFSVSLVGARFVRSILVGNNSIQYEDGEKAYIIAPVGLTDGDVVVYGEGADINPGNA